MNVKYSKNLTQAFIAGPSELTKLTELLQDRIGKVEIHADCADNLSRQFETVDDLISYENPKSKEIRCIHLRVSSNHILDSSSIVLPSTDGISIQFTESEDVVSVIRDDILDILAGMRPWYNMLSLINSYPAPVFTYFVACLVALSVDLWLYEYSSKIGVAGIIMGLICVIPAILFLLHKLFNFLFPLQVFTIGQGELRFKDKEWVRWGVVIGFPISLAAGLIIWLMTR